MTEMNSIIAAEPKSCYRYQFIVQLFLQQFIDYLESKKQKVRWKVVLRGSQGSISNDNFLAAKMGKGGNLRLA